MTVEGVPLVACEVRRLEGDLGRGSESSMSGPGSFALVSNPASTVTSQTIVGSFVQIVEQPAASTQDPLENVAQTPRNRVEEMARPAGPDRPGPSASPGLTAPRSLPAGSDRGPERVGPTTSSSADFRPVSAYAMPPPRPTAMRPGAPSDDSGTDHEAARRFAASQPGVYPPDHQGLAGIRDDGQRLWSAATIVGSWAGWAGSWLVGGLAKRDPYAWAALAAMIIGGARAYTGSTLALAAASPSLIVGFVYCSLEYAWEHWDTAYLWASVPESAKVGAAAFLSFSALVTVWKHRPSREWISTWGFRRERSTRPAGPTAGGGASGQGRGGQGQSTGGGGDGRSSSHRPDGGRQHVASPAGAPQPDSEADLCCAAQVGWSALALRSDG